MAAWSGSGKGLVVIGRLLQATTPAQRFTSVGLQLCILPTRARFFPHWGQRSAIGTDNIMSRELQCQVALLIRIKVPIRY